MLLSFLARRRAEGHRSQPRGPGARRTPPVGAREALEYVVQECAHAALTVGSGSVTGVLSSVKNERRHVQVWAPRSGKRASRALPAVTSCSARTHALTPCYIPPLDSGYLWARRECCSSTTLQSRCVAHADAGPVARHSASGAQCVSGHRGACHCNPPPCVLFLMKQTKERMAAFKTSRGNAESESEFHDSFGSSVPSRCRGGSGGGVVGRGCKGCRRAISIPCQ